MDMRYERPTTLADACSLLAQGPGPAVVLAGGTDLQIKLRARAIAPALVVDIKAIPGLSDIRWDGDGLRLGAAVTMRQIYEDRRIVEAYPALAEGAESVGSLQIRGRATVGGNLCNASPCMDTAPPLLLMRATVEVARAGGSRVIPIDHFFVGVKKTLLAPGEICTAIVVPAASTRLRTAFGKIKRVHGHDLALVNCAVAWDVAAGTLRAAVGSCCQTPVLTRPLDGVGPGASPADVSARLVAAAQEVICPIDDVRASAEYRRDMTSYLCRRLVQKLLAPAAGRAA
jgi:carbon-monoxide dehydrogenase medium subunit